MVKEQCIEAIDDVLSLLFLLQCRIIYSIPEMGEIKCFDSAALCNPK